MLKFLSIFGSIWLIIGIPLTLAGVSTLKKEYEFEALGVTVSGTVLAKRTEQHTSRDSSTKTSHTTTSYYVDYSFTAPDGTVFKSSDSVSSEQWPSIGEGDQIELQYLSASPDVNRISRESSSVAGFLLCGFGVLCLAIGGGSLGYAIHRWRFVKRLKQHGVLVEGEIELVGPGSVTINNVEQWQIRYSYRDQRGQKFQGYSEHMPPDRASEWQAGAKGRVRYDPQNSSKSIWIGRDSSPR